MSAAKQKVLAYITREQHGTQQLLVFTHRDHPDAGVQVPGGSIDPGEAPAEAVWREVAEEAGLTGAQIRLVRKVGAYLVPITWVPELAGITHERHVFHFEAAVMLPDTWSHVVSAGAEDKGLRFDYYWVDLTGPIDLLGKMGDYLADMLAQG